MYVSTRFLFPNFSLVWISILNKGELCPTTRYAKLTEELIKELKIEKGIEWSMSVFLLEYEGKKSII